MIKTHALFDPVIVARMRAEREARAEFFDATRDAVNDHPAKRRAAWRRSKPSDFQRKVRDRRLRIYFSSVEMLRFSFGP
jgi:hypothetical protein